METVIEEPALTADQLKAKEKYDRECTRGHHQYLLWMLEGMFDKVEKFDWNEKKEKHIEKKEKKSFRFYHFKERTSARLTNAMNALKTSKYDMWNFSKVFFAEFGYKDAQTLYSSLRQRSRRQVG